MDKPLHDHAAGRNQTPDDPNRNSAASRDRTQPDPGTSPATRPTETVSEEPVVVCAWCPSLHILKMQRREQDVVVIYWQAKELKIIRNGVNLKISHGICVPCRERMKKP